MIPGGGNWVLISLAVLSGPSASMGGRDKGARKKSIFDFGVATSCLLGDVTLSWPEHTDKTHPAYIVSRRVTLMTLDNENH